MRTREQQATIASPEAGLQNANGAHGLSGRQVACVVEEGGATMADRGYSDGVHPLSGLRHAALRLADAEAAQSECDTVFRG